MEGFAILVFFAFIYFVPAVVARGKRNFGAIFALNLFLGWTLIGWVGALVWALTKDDKK
ncbi:MAG: superinfection immunity protein [Candidatus Marinimicrobia bacterium]|nr:superinfection immunity protein [Candidatus Neomarinimicrobiota bacterium]